MSSRNGACVSLVAVVSLLVLLCCTCCLGWPTGSYRRAYNYFPPMMTAEYAAPAANQWSVAQEPFAYDQPEDYYGESDNNDQQQWADVEALSSIMDMYDNAPVWGQVVNEPPETELELEQLKAQQKRQQKSEEKAETTTTGPKTTMKEEKVKAMPQQSAKMSPKNSPVAPAFQGQKEIPLLRPAAVRVRTTTTTAAPEDESPWEEEPHAIVAQRRSSPVAERPSAYDTLRKYLSIEDSLQKEVQKRRASNSRSNNNQNYGSHQNKRSSSIIKDTDTLTQQLNNLKKSVM